MKGEEIFHFMGCSCFSQYIVCADISLAKVYTHMLCTFVFQPVDRLRRHLARNNKKLGR
jgi:hypothetical protein